MIPATIAHRVSPGGQSLRPQYRRCQPHIDFCRLTRAVCTTSSRSGAAPQIILVEGLFDFAVLQATQAGFHGVTYNKWEAISMRSSTANSCDFGGTVYLAFDSDFKQSGQQGAQRISACLASRGLIVRRIQLPNGHDPNELLSSKVPATPSSFNACWRKRTHDLPR